MKKTVVIQNVGITGGGEIRRCDCKHEFQDKTYGKNKRVMSILAGNKGYRCTVCSKEYR